MLEQEEGRESQFLVEVEEAKDKSGFDEAVPLSSQTNSVVSQQQTSRSSSISEVILVG